MRLSIAKCDPWRSDNRRLGMGEACCLAGVFEFYWDFEGLRRGRRRATSGRRLCSLRGSRFPQRPAHRIISLGLKDLWCQEVSGLQEMTTRMISGFSRHSAFA